MILCKNLTVCFGKTEVLHNVSCEFPSGEITGLMGRNGSGKTVLLKALCGMVIPQSGEILLDGQRLTPNNVNKFSIGTLIETPGYLRNYSALKNLEFIASLTGKNAKARAKDALFLVGLDWKLKKHVGAYSLGMRQRLGIAQAFLDDPDIILLDEPMNALDQECIRVISEQLRRLADAGKTIVIASHYIEDLKDLCSHLYQLADGEIHEVS